MYFGYFICVCCVLALLFLLQFVCCKASIIGVSDCAFFIISLTVGCFSLTVILGVYISFVISVILFLFLVLFAYVLVD